jgi:hypothetical protein
MRISREVLIVGGIATLAHTESRVKRSHWSLAEPAASRREPHASQHTLLRCSDGRAVHGRYDPCLL